MKTKEITPGSCISLLLAGIILGASNYILAAVPAPDIVLGEDFASQKLVKKCGAWSEVEADLKQVLTDEANGTNGLQYSNTESTANGARPTKTFNGTLKFVGGFGCLAIISDDGCTVHIREHGAAAFVPYVNKFGTGQALTAAAFETLPVLLKPDTLYDVKVEYSQTHYTPKPDRPDIDGATLYACHVPAEFVPDWNRDGMINDEDRGKATDGEPFMFWINDDNDDNPEPEVADIPKSGNDANDLVVNGERDLVDFFPVQTRLEKLLRVFPAENYTYKISHPTGAFHFIEMPNVQPDSQRSNGAGSYLANETIAAEAMSRPMKDTSGNGSELSAEYLVAVKNGKGVLLFESKSATEESFQLVVADKKDNAEVVKIARALPVEMEDVEKMYWRANIRPAVYNQPVSSAVPPAWEKFKNARKNRWFIFCHGYNINENRARG